MVLMLTEAELKGIKSRARLIRDFIEEYESGGNNRDYLAAAIQLSIEIQNKIGDLPNWPDADYKFIETRICRDCNIT